MVVKDDDSGESQNSPIAGFVERILHHGESGLYIAVAIFLGLGAVVLSATAILEFPNYLSQTDAQTAVLRVLEQLLLVIMLIEIIHTVGISLKSRRLQCEPFLIVGVIAAVRRMLIITAEAAKPTPDEFEQFRLMMFELGILTFMILSLTIGITILRRKATPTSS